MSYYNLYHSRINAAFATIHIPTLKTTCFWLSLLLFNSGCEERNHNSEKKIGDTSTLSVNHTTQKPDSLVTSSALKESARLKFLDPKYALDECTRIQKLNVFIISEILSIDGGIVFVSLSDIYPLSNHPDSLAIPEVEPSDIGDPNFEGSDMENSGIKRPDLIDLKGKYRKRFLKEAHIAETDSIFIYNYRYDELTIFHVKNVNVSACINIYAGSDDQPYGQGDYMYGFSFDKKKIFKKNRNDNYEYFICVDKENPFEHGRITPVIWKPIKPEEVPFQETDSRIIAHSGRLIKGNAYRFKTELLNYYIQDYHENDQLYARRFFVKEIKNGKIFSKIKFIDTEGTSPAPLTIQGLDDGEIANQWTGKLFKNCSDVIFGFEYTSFGCPEINILNVEGCSVEIKCDNRH